MNTALDTEIALIPSEAVRKLTQTVLSRCPACFWTMPAATTGKYHPAISLGEGGLVRHTKAVVRLTCHLLAMQGTEAQSAEYSAAIAAAILHDCCKKRDDEKWTAFDHPTRAGNLIRQVGADLAAQTPAVHERASQCATIAAIVDCHMGRWNTDPRSGIELPRPLTPLERLVHCADYLASRKDITIADIS